MNAKINPFSKLLAVGMVLALLLSSITIASASQENYLHWLDGPPPAAGSWSNTAIQKTNSAYFEDEVVPVYFVSRNLTIGTIYAFNIYYDYYDTGKDGCGYDYLAQYNTSRTTTFILGTPTANAPLPEGHGNFYTVGANITSVGAPTNALPQRYVQVTFTANAATAEFYWGFHLSPPGAINGTCTGASQWPGASVQTDIKTTPSVAGAIMVGGGGNMQANPSAITRGQITGGLKWNDLNGNAAKDANEPVLPGWTIQLCTDSACNSVLDTTTTAANGSYAFVEAPGSYYIREVGQTNWLRTFPASVSGIQGPYTISTATPAVAGPNFGNWSPADLSVSKTTTADSSSNFNDPFKYTIVVTNNGYNGNAIDFLSTFNLTDTLPSYLKLVNTPTPAGNLTVTGGGGGTCDPVNYDVYGATISCTLNPLNYQSQVTIEFWVLKDPNYPDSIVNTASIANYNNGTCPSPNSFGNQVEVSCTNNVSTVEIVIIPTAVTVAGPEASVINQSILVDWLSYNEVNILGFKLYRSTNPNAPASARSLVYQTPPKHPGEMIGDTYQYTDTDVRLGYVYTYWLIVQYMNGATETMPPTSASLGIGGPTLYLPGIRR